MTRHKYQTTLVVAGIALLVLLAVRGTAAANGFSIPWWTVDGGGYISSQGGGYVLGGTAGQSDAGPTQTGGGYTLNGGFWPAAISGMGGEEIYLPVILRGW